MQEEEKQRIFNIVLDLRKQVDLKEITIDDARRAWSSLKGYAHFEEMQYCFSYIFQVAAGGMKQLHDLTYEKCIEHCVKAKKEIDELYAEEEREKEENKQWGLVNNFPQLKHTKQYQIVFELYQYPGTSIDSKTGTYIHFQHEGTEYIFRNLALHNENSDYGCDFYWVDFHTYPQEQEEEYVNPKDFVFYITAYKAKDVQKLIDNPKIKDGPLGFGRAVEELEMLEDELSYDSTLPKYLLDQARNFYTLTDDWALHILKYHLNVDVIENY